MNINIMNIVLPIEIVENILLYGDPDVTQKYSAVIRQINYYRNEYNYLRKQAFNFYYKWNKHDIIYFIFHFNIACIVFIIRFSSFY